MTRFLKAADPDLMRLNLMLLLQASTTVVGAFLPLLATVFYLALAIFYIIDPIRLVRSRPRRRAGLKVSTGG